MRYAMTNEGLKPWMLRADWRDDPRSFAVIDLTAWPADVPLSPRPPVPVIGVGDPGHPLAPQLDLVVASWPLANLVIERIRRHPRAAAVVADLLRAVEDMEPEPALTCESMAYASLQAGREHTAWLAARRPTPSAAPGRVHIARHADVLTVTIDRPGARNAIDVALRDGLHDAFSLAALDLDITAVRLRALGRCFGVGADLSEFGVTEDGPTAHALRARTLPARALLPRASICHTHVRGACVGASLELAAFSGRLTASPDAWFQLPELEMGVLPGAGGCVSLTRRIGRQRTALMILSGKRISASVARNWGLVDAIVDTSAGDEGGANVVG